MARAAGCCATIVAAGSSGACSTTPTFGRVRTARAATRNGACCAACGNSACRCLARSPQGTCARASYRADLITEELPSRLTLAQALAAQPVDPRRWRAIGRCVGRLHAHGVRHADLNAHNLVLGETDDVYVLDFDRGRIVPRGAWEQSVLARLRRSLDKVTRELPVGRFGDDNGAKLLRPGSRRVRIVYVLLTYLLAPVVIGLEAWKALWNPEYRGRLHQRLGFVSPQQRPAACGCTRSRWARCRRRPD